jgi:outer membrane receptor for ferrienterochelin and colicin
MGRIATWLAVLALLTGVSGARADEAPPRDVGDEIVVTADRRPTLLADTPEIIRVITAEDIEELHVNSTGEILERVTGINTASGTGSGFPKRSVVSIGGLPANHVLVLVNGQRLLSEHGHTGQNIDLIPPEAIARIEVIQTAASAQYGSDAIGGVVNIITRDEVPAPTGKVYGSYGRYNDVNVGAGLRAPLGRRVHASLMADVDRSDGAPLLVPAHRIGAMGYSRVSVLGDLDIGVTDDVAIDLYLNWIENEMEWSGGPAHNRLIMPKVALRAALTDRWELYVATEYTGWRSEVSRELNQLVHPEAWVTWEAWAGRNRLTIGGDSTYARFRRTGLDRAMEQSGMGLFVHDALHLDRRWSFSGSVRMDLVDDLLPVVSPKVAALYRPIREIGIRTAVGRGFHAPTVQERHEQAYGHGGAALRFGNPDLEAETSTAFSLSFEFLPTKGLEILVNGTFHLVDNFITPRYAGPWEVDPSKDKWVRENVLQAWVYGAEASFAWRLARWIRIGGGYSYAGSQDRGGGRLPFDPGHSAFGRVDLRFVFARGVSLGAFTQVSVRVGRKAWSWKPEAGAPRHDETGYVTSLDDYQLFDAGADLAYLGRYRVYATVTNMLAQDIERLDDALTRLDGAPVYRFGLKLEF